MKIASTVNAILGKKKKSDVSTSGKSLILEQIAIATSDKNSGIEPGTKQSQPRDKSAKTTDTQQKQPSVSDLDFMEEPLAEIDLIKNLIPNSTKSTSAQNGKNDEENNQTERSNIPSGSDIALAQVLRNTDETCFMMFGPEGEFIESTSNFSDITGVSAADQASMNCYLDMVRFISKRTDFGDKDAELISQEEANRMQEILSKGVSKSYKFTAPMRSGKTLEFTNNYTTNHHIITIIKDVTKQTEKDHLLRAGLELGTVGYWSYSFITGKSVLSEYMMSKLSDAQLARVRATGITSIIHPEDAARVQSAFEQAIASHSRMECEFRVVLEDNSELILHLIGETKISAISQKPERFIAFLNDLTENRERIKELKDIKELSRNKSEFLARMSHEIKTPLNAIVGMTDALRDEVGNNDEARETARFIADAAENLNNILSQTLEHERLSIREIVLDEELSDITDVVKSTAAVWKKTCENKGVKLILRISPDIPQQINLDKSRFRQCLTNILSNAVKFTETGSIIIAVAQVKSETTSPKILVAVRDTGIGMSREAVGNIFKPFKQGSLDIQRQFGGSGLGMSITKQIIDRMGGSIKVNSDEGKGATIALTLPLKTETDNNQEIDPTILPKKQAEQHTTIESQNLPAETFHPIKASKRQSPTPKQSDTEVRKNVAIIPSDYSGFDVLIVEDNPINQAVVKKLLKNHIRSMDFAFHGDEALEMLETKTFDVILMDIHMPIKDGIETTLEIRNSGKTWADTVIIALTADPDYQQKRVCRNIGMNDALSKPVKRQELLDILQKVLNDKVSNTPEQLSA